jgi:hypothetical protein
MLQFENKRTVTICAGVGGSGKSTFALRYLVNAPLDVRFIFDPENEYSQRLQMPAATNGYELDLQLCQGWVLFDPHTLFAGRVTEAFAFFCDWAFTVSERLPGRKVLVVDEVWKYCTPQSIPPELATVCQTGRKRGLTLMVNTQLPNKLNGSILNEWSEFVCFRLGFEKAIAVAVERGFNAQQISSLPDLEFISRTDVGGELRGKIKL